MSPAAAEYDEDDVYDPEDYDELNPEDQEAMDRATKEVCSALGVDVRKVTLDQVHDAVWHYYFDVEKSLAYLRKTVVGPKSAPPKAAPKATPKAPAKKVAEEKPRLPPRFYFDDMPWFNIPSKRETTFIAPVRPRGGLLGGGEAGMSKLQKLAAARKKKTEEAKEKEAISGAQSGIDNMAISEKGPSKDRPRPMPPSAKRQKTVGAETIQTGVTDLLGTIANNGETRQRELEQPVGPQDEVPGSPDDHDEVVSMPKAQPSEFARALFGDRRRGPVQGKYPIPYSLHPSYDDSIFSKPSPDDIVFAAQSQAGKKAPTKAKGASKEVNTEDSKDSGTAGDLSSLTITDAPPPKSKGLDVIKEWDKSSVKRSLSFVVVGHVDAGKSTLMGRLLWELKFVDDRTVNKYRRQAEKSGKSSFALAWVMDQRSEERERGVTIDVATDHFETDNTKFTILDAPGHRDFVPNMIAGASQADFAILVIDANTGAYEKGLKGQTREHVLLLRSLGVQRLIVAVNKLDMVDWSKGRFDEISQEVSGFLSGLGFQLAHITFVPISGLNGDNTIKAIEDPGASWYTGPTLIEALEASKSTATRALKKPLRMAISEVFRSQQGTTTLAGRIDSGTMQVGDVLVVQPSGETAYIKSIMVDGTSQDWAVAGQSVSMALTNIDPIHIRVGDILCHAKDAIACGDTFVMKAMAFEHLLPSPVDLHRGRLHAAGMIQSLIATLDKASGEIIKKKPQVVQPGGVARIKIKLESKVPLESGQRVVIRSGGETVAAGLLE